MGMMGDMGVKPQLLIELEPWGISFSTSVSTKSASRIVAIALSPPTPSLSVCID